MNKRTGVVHKPLGLDLGKPATVTAGDKSNAQAMKACLDASFSEDGIDASIFVSGKGASYISTRSFDDFERWLELRMDWYRKILPWIILAALGISQPNSAACQVDILHWNRALTEPASGIESDFKTDPHPLGLVCEFRPNLRNVVVGQFRFDLLRGPRNAEPGDGIRFCELASDRFIDELGEEFDLQESGIVADRFSMDFSRQSPADIRPTVGISDLPRVNDALLVQKGFNGAPRDRVTPSRIACALPVRSDVAGYPCVKSRGLIRPANSLFVSRGSISQSLSFSCVGSVVDAQAGGFLDPRTRIKVTSAKVPERGSLFLNQVRHVVRIGHRRTKIKENNVECRDSFLVETWGNECWQILPLHYEASFFPVENRPVGQESDISGCFLSPESKGGSV